MKRKERKARIPKTGNVAAAKKEKTETRQS
jgi:hypothetical protein